MLLDLAQIICKTKTRPLTVVFPNLACSWNDIYAEKQSS